MLLEVRKPGRPLTSCPHPAGSCSCERVVVNFTIPKTSECACPSTLNASTSASTLAGNSRVKKPRHRKSTSVVQPSILERAIKIGNDGDTDSSSILTQTASGDSNNASSPSSASSTPHISPQSANEETEVIALPTVEPAQSSCCKPKQVQVQSRSCCGTKSKEAPKLAQPKKASCCGGGGQEEIPTRPVQAVASCCSARTPTQSVFPQAQGSHVVERGFNQFNDYSAHAPQHMRNMPNAANTFPSLPLPFNFNTPIYNHVNTGFHTPPASVPMSHTSSHVSNHTTKHNCHCGDSCSCFGCAAHPNNATMIEYLRSMQQFMSTGQFGAIPPPNYDMPTFPHHPGFGAEAGLAYNNHATPNSFPSAGSFNFQPSVDISPMNRPNLWQQAAVHNPVQDSSLMAANFFRTAHGNGQIPVVPQESPSQAFKSEEALTDLTIAESPPESQDNDAGILSPSSYLWQEIVLPGCNDATGTCQCGDGCECVGCLTHGGHNGVPLDDGAPPSSTAMASVYDEFGIGLGSSSHYAPFSTAPT